MVVCGVVPVVCCVVLFLSCVCVCASVGAFFIVSVRVCSCARVNPKPLNAFR